MNRSSGRTVRAAVAAALATSGVIAGLPAHAGVAPPVAPLFQAETGLTDPPDGADPDEPAEPGDDGEGPGSDPDSPTPPAAATPQEKTKAAAVVKLPLTEELLSLADRDFTWEVWKKAAPNSEVRAEAELAMDGYDPATRDCGACAAFIRAGIHDAHTRDIAQQKVAEELARQSRLRRQDAARVIGMPLGATPEEQATALARGDREFTYQVHKFLREQRPRHTRTREEALRAAEGSAEDLVAFLGGKAAEAYHADERRIIVEDTQADKDEQERRLRWQAREAACVAVVVDCQPGWEKIADDDFIRQLRARMDKETFVIVLDRSETLLVDGDARAWREFVEKGIHEAKKADVERAERLIVAKWRAVVEKIRDDAVKEGLKNRARAAREVLRTATTVAALKQFHQTHQSIAEGDSDLAAFYDYGKNTVGAWTFHDLGRAKGRAHKRWTSPKSWTFGSFSSTSADYTGDGRRDVMAMYRVKEGTYRLYMFDDVDSGKAAPVRVWDTSAAKDAPGYRIGFVMSGDVDGDRRGEVLAFARTPKGEPVLLTFRRQPDGKVTMAAHPTDAALLSSWPTIGDVDGDGDADLAALAFDKDEAHLSLVLNDRGAMKAPKRVWSGPAKEWAREDLRPPVAADVDGDGASELVTARHDGAKKTSVWVFDKLTQKVEVARRWQTNGWHAKDLRLAAGDVDGDGRTDLLGSYRFADSHMKLWLWTATSGGFANPRLAYESTAWNWSRTDLAK